MASPYVSEDQVPRKNGKRISTLRSPSGGKNYPKSDYSSIQNEPSADMMHPNFIESSNILEDSLPYSNLNDSTNNNYIIPESTEKIEKSMPVVNSFYKNTSDQQKQLSSALNKLFGSSGQEGMSNFNPDVNAPDSKLTTSDISNPLQKDFIKNTGLVTAGSSFGRARNGTGGCVIPTTPLDPMPMEYLRNSGYGGVKPYTDYESGYSTGVIPPHLANYSYPGVADSLMSKDVSLTQDNNVLLEKISYMIYLLEQQKQEKKKNTTEEFVLYSFLGVFMIYIVDSFARSGRYIH